MVWHDSNMAIVLRNDHPNLKPHSFLFIYTLLDKLKLTLFLKFIPQSQKLFLFVIIISITQYTNIYSCCLRFTIICLFILWDRISQSSLGLPPVHRDLPTSATNMVGLVVCAIHIHHSLYDHQLYTNKTDTWLHHWNVKNLHLNLIV